MRDESIRFQNYKNRVALRFRVRCVLTFKAKIFLGFWICFWSQGMLEVITEKSCHISNQSQRAILPEVTCAI